MNAQGKGKLRLNLANSTNRLDDERGAWVAGIEYDLALNPTPNSAFRLQVRAPVVSQPRSERSVKLTQAYVAFHGPALDVVAGRQILTWGRADAINPTDNLSPRDMSTLLPFEEDQRMGTRVLKVAVFPSAQATISFVVLPFFEPNKVPVPPGNSPLSEVKPPTGLGHAGYALKLDHAGTGFDWSVSWFDGYGLNPEAHPRTTDVGIEWRYPHLQVLGGDMAQNFGRYGFRAEAAYYRPQRLVAGGESVLGDYFSYVIGADRTFGENLNINVQLLGRWNARPGGRGSRTTQDEVQAAEINDIGYLSWARQVFGLSARVSKRWLNDTLEGEMLVVAYAGRSSSFFRPMLSYAFTDNVRGTIGAQRYRGAADSVFGRLRQNNALFAELRYSF